MYSLLSNFLLLISTNLCPQSSVIGIGQVPSCHAKTASVGRKLNPVLNYAQTLPGKCSVPRATLSPLPNLVPLFCPHTPTPKHPHPHIPVS